MTTPRPRDRHSLHVSPASALAWRDALTHEWRRAFRVGLAGRELGAGVAVALAAIPLSLAIALASDVDPRLGVVSAVVGGLLAATFGSSRRVVTAPAAALAVIVGGTVDRGGPTALVIAGVTAGLAQMLAGFRGLGFLARALPESVIRGFTAGVSVLLVIGQLPRLMGLRAPDSSHTIDVLLHIGSYVHELHPTALMCGVFAIVATSSTWGSLGRLPLSFIAVAVPTAVVVLLDVDANELPLVEPFRGPSATFTWGPRSVLAAMGDGLLLAFVASVDTLARANEVDRRPPGEPELDANHEIAAQGFANVIVSLAGLMPVSGVLARSRILQRFETTTRLPLLYQAVGQGVVLALTWPLLARIPVAALAGALVGLLVQRLSIAYVRQLAGIDRTEVALFALTSITVVAVDFGAGMEAGVLAAVAVALFRAVRVRITLQPATDVTPHHVAISGSLTFVQAAKVQRLERRLLALDPAPGVVIDLRHVVHVDATAGGGLVRLVEHVHENGLKVALLGANADVRQTLESLRSREIEGLFAMREADLDRLLPRSRAAHAHKRLVAGVDRFRAELRDPLSPLLKEIAAGQEPHTLFVTCCDSRVAPALITGSAPGELFVVRNIGALVPRWTEDASSNEGAAVEYAVRVLGVRNIVVCAHSRCGAMHALKTGELPRDLPTLGAWGKRTAELVGDLSSFAAVDDASRATAVKQREHLLSYPVVQASVERGELQVSAWFYDVELADVHEWDPNTGAYHGLIEPR